MFYTAPASENFPATKVLDFFATDFTMAGARASIPCARVQARKPEIIEPNLSEDVNVPQVHVPALCDDEATVPQVYDA